jgi:hypothetical protein
MIAVHRRMKCSILTGGLVAFSRPTPVITGVGAEAARLRMAVLRSGRRTPIKLLRIGLRRAKTRNHDITQMSVRLVVSGGRSRECYFGLNMVHANHAMSAPRTSGSQHEPFSFRHYIPLPYCIDLGSLGKCVVWRLQTTGASLVQYCICPIFILLRGMSPEQSQTFAPHLHRTCTAPASTPAPAPQLHR